MNRERRKHARATFRHEPTRCELPGTNKHAIELCSEALSRGLPAEGRGAARIDARLPVQPRNTAFRVWQDHERGTAQGGARQPAPLSHHERQNDPTQDRLPSRWTYGDCDGCAPPRARPRKYPAGRAPKKGGLIRLSLPINYFSSHRRRSLSMRPFPSQGQGGT